MTAPTVLSGKAMSLAQRPEQSHCQCSGRGDAGKGWVPEKHFRWANCMEKAWHISLCLSVTVLCEARMDVIGRKGPEPHPSFRDRKHEAPSCHGEVRRDVELRSPVTTLSHQTSLTLPQGGAYVCVVGRKLIISHCVWTSLSQPEGGSLRIPYTQKISPGWLYIQSVFENKALLKTLRIIVFW